jgi:hypothetical protein
MRAKSGVLRARHRPRERLPGFDGTVSRFYDALSGNSPVTLRANDLISRT